jgi:prevent-host-death family protein
MTAYSVAEAKNKFSELIGRAEKGEEVVITRHGQPVIKLSAISPPPPRVVTAADLDWLRERSKDRGRLSEEDAGTLVSRMRDEDWR